MQDKSLTPRAFRILLIVLIVAWAGLPLALILLKGAATAGVLGDSFNIATSLFSGLALLGIIYTINEQRIEMVDQRRAAKDAQTIARKELQQLSDSCRISLIQVLLAEHRQALKLVVPGSDAETSGFHLDRLRKRIVDNPSIARDYDAAIEMLDEMASLRSELSEIRHRSAERE